MESSRHVARPVSVPQLATRVTDFRVTYSAKHGFLGAAIAEIGILLALFLRYAQDWGKETAVVALFLVPVGIALWSAYRATRSVGSTSAVSSWHASPLMMLGVAIGLLGMSFALAVGPHLSGSAAICVAIVQAGIFGLVALRSRKQRGNSQ